LDGYFVGSMAFLKKGHLILLPNSIWSTYDKKCYIESISINCSEIISEFSSLIYECLSSLFDLKLVASIIDQVCVLLHYNNPIEEASFMLDGRYPVSFHYKEAYKYIWWLLL
jgi:hypothetical protein